MKQFSKTFLHLSLLLIAGAASSLMADCSSGSCGDSSLSSCGSNGNNDCDRDCVSTSTCRNCHSIFIPRSAHSNSAYFWTPYRDDVDVDDWSGSVALGFEYQRTFDNCDIARCMFGSNKLHFQGSRVANRDSSAIIADNFGLSQLCDTTLSFSPRIQNFNLHFQSRWGFDCWLEGLYGELNFTFSHQRRTLFDDNCVSNSGTTTVPAGTNCTTPFPAGYMTFGGPAATVTDLKTALGGQATFGDMKTPWAFGRFVFCEQSENKVAGVSVILGYDFERRMWPFWCILPIHSTNRQQAKSNLRLQPCCW